MKIRALHSSDWHISETSTVPVNVQLKNMPTPVNVRTSDTFKRIRMMVDYALEHHIKYFIIAGDVYDKPITSMYLKKWFSKYISKLIKNNVKVIIVVGNHDSDGNVNAFSDIKELIKDSSGLYIIDKAGVVKTKYINFVCIPYDSAVDANHFLQSDECRKMSDYSKKNILIGHFGALESVIGNTQMSSALIAEVEMAGLRGYDYAALGDYHIYQKVGDDRTRKSNEIWYAGSIIRLNMGETEDKYFNVITLDTESYAASSVKSVKLKDRNYLTFGLTYEDMVRYVKSSSARAEMRYSIEPGDVVRFVSKTTPKKALIIEPKFLRLINKIYKPVYSTLKWEYESTQNKRSKGYGLSIVPLKAMERYIKGNRTNLDSDELLRLHKQIVKEYGDK